MLLNHSFGLFKQCVSLLKKQDEIRTEMNNLELTLEEARDRIESARTALETARQAYAITEISSREGLATQLDLKDALLSRDGAELGYYMSIYDYLDAYFSWQQAVGMGDRLPE